MISAHPAAAAEAKDSPRCHQGSCKRHRAHRNGKGEEEDEVELGRSKACTQLKKSGEGEVSRALVATNDTRQNRLETKQTSAYSRVQTSRGMLSGVPIIAPTSPEEELYSSTATRELEQTLTHNRMDNPIG